MRKIKRREFTYYEFVRYAKNRKAVAMGASKLMSRKESNHKTDWTKTETFEEAYELSVNGWDAGMRQLELEDGLLVESGMEFNPSVQGAVVNIGAYLQGLPEQMYDLTEKREYNLEPLTVYVQLAYSCKNAGDAAMRFTKSMLKFINEYQSKYNLRIIGVFDTLLNNNERAVNKVLIKDFDKRFVLNNLAFSLHPSFFRRLYFSILEAEPHLPSCYGWATDALKVESEIRKSHEGGTAYLLPQLDVVKGSFNEDKILQIA